MSSGRAGVEIRVLGPLAVLVDGVPADGVGGPKPRALLSRLIVAAGETVPADRLVDDVWGAEPPRSVSSTLHGYISTLRRAVEPGHGSGEPSVLVRRGNGYALLLDDDALDADRFLTLARRGREQLAAGDTAAALATLDAALELWTGEAYADSRDWEFAVREAERLSAVRSAAVEDRLTALSDMGENDLVVAETSAAVRADPLAERTWELLALAHYRAGRPADAAATLKRAADALATELGVDPGPGLQRLSERIARRDPALASRAAPARIPGPRRALPVPLTSFVGREDDLTRVAALLAAERLVTLTGPGGIGKTRLAIEAAGARDLADGPWFVELAGFDGAALIEEVMRVLGVAAAGGPDRLAAVIGDRETLLVLDNCEHVVADAAQLVAHLLAHCRRLRILTTSRLRLGVAGEAVYRLDPLEDGADLFFERAAALSGDEQREQVAALCAALDNLPLAIELAAARTVVLSVRQLTDMLGERFALLSDAQRANRPADARHASMQAVIDGSFGALSAGEKTLFTDLSVFAGSFDFDAVVQVIGGHVGALLTGIGALVDKSMITVIGGDPRRYRMLEVLREYGAERLAEARRSQLRAAHLRWVTALVQRVHGEMRGPDCVHWAGRLDDELPNVHAALDYGREHDWPAYVTAVSSLYWFWYRRGYVAEGRRRLAPLTGAGARLDALPAPARLQAYIGQLLLAYQIGDQAEMADGLGRIESLLTSTVSDDSGGAGTVQADASAVLAMFVAGSGDVEGGRRWAARADRLAVTQDLPLTRAEARLALGVAAYRSHDHPLAQELLAGTVSAALECGCEWLAASALWIAVKDDLAAGHSGAPTRAKLAAMLGACERASDFSTETVALATLAYVCFLNGDARPADLTAAARLTGVVQRRRELTGFDPERMDPVDTAEYAAQIRAAAPGAGFDWAREVEAGRALDEAGVDALVAACLK
ncbi:MAG: BTAD domain-containing putative transcriptional regulator [Gordonia sp. (in: high G+C Gram-positive bacteria)]